MRPWVPAKHFAFLWVLASASFECNESIAFWTSANAKGTDLERRRLFWEHVELASFSAPRSYQAEKPSLRICDDSNTALQWSRQDIVLHTHCRTCISYARTSALSKISWRSASHGPSAIANLKRLATNSGIHSSFTKPLSPLSPVTPVETKHDIYVKFSTGQFLAYVSSCVSVI